MALKLASNKTSRRSAATRDEDEYAGLWINVGVENTEVDEETGEETTKFLRLPRGIAISDLTDHRVFASTHENNPDWAQEATTVNSIMDVIREAASELEDGESRSVNMSVQIYKRQEQVEQVAPKAVANNV